MISLRSLREEQAKVAELSSIVSSLQIVSITQMRQFAQRKRIYNKVVSTVEGFMNQVSSDIKINYGKKPLHLILSCDQKFCRKLLSMLENHISSLNLPQDSKIMLFGSRSRKFLKRILPNAEIHEYRSLMNIEECERVAFEIRKTYPITYLHSYQEDIKDYKSIQLLPIRIEKQYEEKMEISKYDQESLIQLFLASKIYYSALETGLRERTDRALTMSEASENAEKSAKELRVLYNKMRQAIVTKEITSAD